ncbi:hypothetical protein CLOSTMETH_01924 [[Clostridium] methylpentosum DSM 5476]|uniref:Uncharacterized protein n=1 Tax=[Clostridium] methylpentosum DSM 5476 TaxID=537013 RepID=C0EDJ7_9FIRM|nr:hypothetical protein CLOSTMETH_01924 [[Clostridium] methylpentosum DSM 5476]
MHFREYSGKFIIIVSSLILLWVLFFHMGQYLHCISMAGHSNSKAPV